MNHTDEHPKASRAEVERKQMLGWDSATPVDVRERLIRDPHPKVRAASAQVASPDQLRRLAEDSRAEVRAAVAANPYTPVEVLKRLVHDRSANVRFWLTTTRHKQILQALKSDPDSYVARTARSALSSRRLHRRLLDAPGEALAASILRRIDQSSGPQ